MKIIYGPKGTGKTQKAIDSANAAAQTAKGHVLFVADTDKNMYDLDRAVRFIDAGRFDIRGQEGFRGFLKRTERTFRRDGMARKGIRGRIRINLQR